MAATEWLLVALLTDDLVEIYGAIQPAVRPLVLIVAGTSKVVFIGLILSEGTRYLGGAGLAVGVDTVMILLFGWYRLAARGVKQARIEGVGV